VLEVSKREAEFQRREGEHYEHSGGSGGGGVREFFRRATSQRERCRDFDATRAGTCSNSNRHRSVDQQGKEYKESHRASLVKVVSCLKDPGQERQQSIFYFSGETNSTMGYVNSFVLLWQVSQI
jgi:hypothetical protein